MNGTEPPPVPEADIKEAWLQSCRTLYEVHPLAPAPSTSAHDHSLTPVGLPH